MQWGGPCGGVYEDPTRELHTTVKRKSQAVPASEKVFAPFPPILGDPERWRW